MVGECGRGPLSVAEGRFTRTSYRIEIEKPTWDQPAQVGFFICRGFQGYQGCANGQPNRENDEPAETADVPVTGWPESGRRVPFDSFGSDCPDRPVVGHRGVADGYLHRQRAIRATSREAQEIVGGVKRRTSSVSPSSLA